MTIISAITTSCDQFSLVVEHTSIKYHSLIRWSETYAILLHTALQSVCTVSVIRKKFRKSRPFIEKIS